jgi:hypothetical protein
MEEMRTTALSLDTCFELVVIFRVLEALQLVRVKISPESHPLTMLLDIS